MRADIAEQKAAISCVMITLVKNLNTMGSICGDLFIGVGALASGDDPLVACLTKAASTIQIGRRGRAAHQRLSNTTSVGYLPAKRAIRTSANLSWTFFCSGERSLCFHSPKTTLSSPSGSRACRQARLCRYTMSKSPRDFSRRPWESSGSTYNA
jgi:hypothetical protein